MNRVLPARSRVLAGSLLALALLVGGCMQMAKADRMEQPRIGLEGYCPVCILDANKWAKGSPDHQATYAGSVISLCPSASRPPSARTRPNISARLQTRRPWSRRRANDPGGMTP